MKRFIKFLQTKYPNHLRHRHEWTYGDWLAIDSWTPRDLIGVAYSAHAAHLLSQNAAVLQKPADARKYARLFDRIRKVFNREFVTPAGRLAGDSQTAYVLALRFDLLPEDKIPAAVEFLAKDIEMRGVLTTGFVGVNLLLPTLSQIGRDDLAYKLLLNERFPSWLYSVKNGATTIWERWDGWTEQKGFQDPGMNSFNHYAYGSCGQWMYAAIAGLDLAQPGYKHALIHPRIGGGLTAAAGSLDTVYGRIASRWELQDASLTLEVTVPPNTSATVVLPAGGITEAGQALDQVAGVSRVERTAETIRFVVVAGQYVFRVAGLKVAPISEVAKK